MTQASPQETFTFPDPEERRREVLDAQGFRAHDIYEDTEQMVAPMVEGREEVTAHIVRPPQPRRKGVRSRSFESDRDTGWNASEGVTDEMRENAVGPDSDGHRLAEQVLAITAERAVARRQARLLGLGALSAEVEEQYRKRINKLINPES